MKSMPHAVHARTMALSYYQMILVLTIQITSISTQWLSYNGLWYYISGGNDTRNYMGAVDYCANLNGHLATIVDYYQHQFLKNQAAVDTKYWVGFSTIHTNHKCQDKDMVWTDDFNCAIDYISNPTIKHRANCSAYTLQHWSSWDPWTVEDCDNQFGFICQWQCHTLGIVANNVPFIVGVYKQQQYKLNRKFYENTDDDPGKFLQYKKYCSWYNRCYYLWVFVYNDDDVLSRPFHNHVPYYQTEWNKNYQEVRNVYFTCMDCHEYEVTVTNGSTVDITILRKRGNYSYTNESDPSKPNLAFDRGSGKWCYTQNEQTHCFVYNIAPKGYVSTFQLESSLIQLAIYCKTTDVHNDNGIDELTITSQNTQSITTTAQIFRSEPIVSTEDNFTSTKHTTILDLHSQAADSQSDDTLNKKENLNTSNGNTYTYIGVAVGVVLVIVIAVIIGVVLYKRRKGSKGNTENATQNLDDVHVITDTNIYFEHPSTRDSLTNRATHISQRNGILDQSNRTGAVPNIPPRSHVQGARRAAPVPDTNTDPIFQLHNLVDVQGDKAGDHGSNTDAHGSSNMPIYSEVNKQKKPVPPVPTAPGYSQMSHKTKIVNSERKQGNIQHKSVNCADNNDVYEAEKMQLGETRSHTGDNSDEEFSDNELYERDASAPTHHQTHIRTNVFDNITFNVDPEGEDIEMVDNDVNAKQ